MIQSYFREDVSNLVPSAQVEDLSEDEDTDPDDDTHASAWPEDAGELVRTMYDGAMIEDQPEDQTLRIFAVPQGEEMAVGVASTITAAHQHELYLHRGSDLQHLSLYEYASLIDVIPKSRAKFGGSRGRNPNPCYNFEPAFRLYSSHMQRIRSKSAVPLICGARPPLHPGLEPPTRRGKSGSDGKIVPPSLLSL